MEMLKERQSQELQIVRTYLEFLEADPDLEWEIQYSCPEYGKLGNSIFRPDIDAGRGWSGSMTFCVKCSVFLD